MEQVWALAQPIAQQLGYSLWDVRFVKEGSEWYLRIFIDKPEGIGIDDCVAMSRAINDPLDRLDPIEQAYCLEVCSPGMNRELTREEHFQAFLGWPVEVRLIRPLEDGRRELLGVLVSASQGEITVDAGEGEPLCLAKAAVSRVRLAEDERSEGEEEEA